MKQPLCAGESQIVPDPTATANQASKKEVDSRSVFVGNVFLIHFIGRKLRDYIALLLLAYPLKCIREFVHSSIWFNLIMGVDTLATADINAGTFALCSLICRHAKVSLLPNQLQSEASILRFRLKVPSAELERSLKIKETFNASLTLKKLLLMLVLAGTSMVIAIGVVMPAMSVISAVGGLKIGWYWIKEGNISSSTRSSPHSVII